MVIFRFVKMAASAIFDFKNFKLLTVERLKRGSSCITLPNLVEIGQTGAEIWRFLDFSKMAAVHHLGFVMGVFGQHTKGIWWSLSLCKILFESIQ